MVIKNETVNAGNRKRKLNSKQMEKSMIAERVYKHICMCMYIYVNSIQNILSQK